MRDAARYSRTKILVDSVGSDGSARALFSPSSFGLDGRDQLSVQPALQRPDGALVVRDTNTVGGHGTRSLRTPAFTGDVPLERGLGANSGSSGGYGLPFAYDPLWRYQTPPGTGSVPSDQSTTGYYLGDQFEARFGNGIGYHPERSVGRRAAERPWLAADHEFQSAVDHDRRRGQSGDADLEVVPSIFVSQEDVVWVEAVAIECVQPGAAGPEFAVVAERAGPGLALLVDVHGIPGELERRRDL